MTQLRTEVQEVEGATLIGLFGELDISEVEQVQKALAAAEAKQPRVLVIDLRGLEFMDSSGIRLVVEADLRARQEDRRLLLIRGPDPVHRVFTIALLDRRLEFVDEPPVEFTDADA
ncbi:MAG TPA: STAS domain-containing protein [Actinomycetota bacterium]|nr:STAS domain-containing protein [Actinomycetota bacterium]